MFPRFLAWPTGWMEVLKGLRSGLERSWNTLTRSLGPARVDLSTHAPSHLGFPEDPNHISLFSFLRGDISQQPLADQLLLPPRNPQCWGQRSRMSMGRAPKTQNPVSPRGASSRYLQSLYPPSSGQPAPASRSRRRRRSSSTPQPTGRRRPCSRLHMVGLGKRARSRAREAGQSLEDGRHRAASVQDRTGGRMGAARRNVTWAERGGLTRGRAGRRAGKGGEGRRGGLERGGAGQHPLRRWVVSLLPNSRNESNST